MNNEITGALFKQMVLHGAAAITAQKQAINDLNVFPVPDGDTGTNMSMTIATAAEALREIRPCLCGPGVLRHRLRPAAGRPRQLRRHPLPAVPGAFQVPEGHGDRGRRRLCRRHAGGRGRRLQGGDEARRGHGADGLPSGCQAGGGSCRRGS